MKQIDAAGIPAVHIATVTPISKVVGANRISLGVAIPHPTANTDLSPEEEKRARLEQVKQAIELLATPAEEINAPAE